MVSFECSACSETIKKPKVKKHLSVCPTKRLTCIDCNENFDSQSVNMHQTCITESQKEHRVKAKTPSENQETKMKATVSIALQVQPWHIEEARKALSAEHPSKRPKLKMLTRHALHIAFLSELRESSQSSERIIQRIAKERCIEFREQS